MNLRPFGVARIIRGFREGNQSMLLGGLALIAFQYLRESGPGRKLVFRKKVPVGSAIVVRHGPRGEPRIEVIKPPKRQTR